VALIESLAHDRIAADTQAAAADVGLSACSLIVAGRVVDGGGVAGARGLVAGIRAAVVAVLGAGVGAWHTGAAATALHAVAFAAVIAAVRVVCEIAAGVRLLADTAGIEDGTLQRRADVVGTRVAVGAGVGMPAAQDAAIRRAGITVVAIGVRRTERWDDDLCRSRGPAEGQQNAGGEDQQRRCPGSVGPRGPLLGYYRHVMVLLAPTTTKPRASSASVRHCAAAPRASGGRPVARGGGGGVWRGWVRPSCFP